MALDWSKMQLEQAAPIDPAEELAEANAWGFDTVEDFYNHMAKEYYEMEADNDH